MGIALRVASALLVSQIAFSLLLLIAAGLVFRSLEKVEPTRLGFSSENVLVASLNLNEARYDRSKSQRFYRELSAGVASLPGVQAVSLVEGMPGGFMSRARRSTEIEGYQPAPGESLHLDFSSTGPHYFTNMKVPFVMGRDFDERDRDGAPCVAIVNEVFAKRYFPAAGAAMGRHLTQPEVEQVQSCEIVGIVRDEKWQSLRAEVQPFFALALMQSYRRQMTLLVHTDGDPARLSAAVRRSILDLDPQMPVNDILTLREYFRTTAYPFRLLGIAVSVCGLMALLLATVGIYGVVTYSVTQRTREVGVRIALGALRMDILRMIVGQGMALVAHGLLLGLLLSFALTRVLSSALFETGLLFGVSATDALTFALVTILLGFVALLACYIPARRAMRVDPMVALRYE